MPPTEEMRTGSPINASFKDDAEAELAWFSVADSLPLLSMSGERAAREEFVARAIQRKRTEGAELYMHAPRNITQEYLERALSCHALIGQPAHPNDPLHPTDGEVRSVSVRSAGDSFAVQVVADEPRVAREILARARAFASGSSVDVQQVGASRSLDGAL